MNSEPDKSFGWLDALASGFQAASRRQWVEEGLDREWYTVPEAATILGEHQKTVYNRISRGELQASKPSPRKTRVHKTDLVNYLLKQTS